MEIKKININMSVSRAKVMVFFNHDFLIKNYSESYLEDNKIFALCFDTTPLDNIADMADYNDLLSAYEFSNRVASKSFYIGNFKKDDWLNIIEQCLETWFPDGHEVVAIEGGFTAAT